MISSPVIELVDFQIGYRSKTDFCSLTSPFSAKLPKGKLIAIVGTNGAGKTTLIKSLTAQISYNGSLYFNGKTPKSYSVEQWAELISLVQTHYQVQAFTNVFDVIAKGRTVHTNWLGHLSEKDNELIMLSAKKLGVDHLLERYFNQLSDGEKQRVLVAMAFAQSSPIMFFDEPTAYLDYPHKFYLTALMKSLCENEDRTIVFSSHDLEVVTKYADLVLLIAQKQIHLIDTKALMDASYINLLIEGQDIPEEFKKELYEHWTKKQ
ncbi:MAG: ABC transporter ATP-binding protein [Bacteroidales bacterium]|nr:ABC transporter ATP-binding protein [Bacteroidales bacterium]